MRCLVFIVAIDLMRIIDADLYETIIARPRSSDEAAMIDAIAIEHNMDVLRGRQSVTLVGNKDDSDRLRAVLQKSAIRHRSKRSSDLSHFLTDTTGERHFGLNMSAFDPGRYYTFEDQMTILNNLAFVYPDLVNVFEIGRSAQNRPIKIARISRAKEDGIDNKITVFLDGGIHSREWIAQAASIHLINYMLSRSSHDPLVDWMLDEADWYIAPNVNPDGYVYTTTTARYWRKNRSGATCEHLSNRCCGVDLNRNFPFKWGESGTSTNVCDETYLGPSAGSEPESKTIMDFIERKKNRLKLYVTIHSFGQTLLVPYGYKTGARPPNYDNLYAVAEWGAAAMTKAHDVKYKAQPSASLYNAAGGSDDWAIGVHNIPYAYTLELRPDPINARLIHFDPPAKTIEPTGDELRYGVAAMLAKILCIDHGSLDCTDPTDLALRLHRTQDIEN